MASVEECARFALEKLNTTHNLKPEQMKTLSTLFKMQDCISVLPTGYGKSLIFQLLPFFFQCKKQMPNPMVTIVVTPLNSIMEEQVQNLCSKGIMACCIDFFGECGHAYRQDTSVRDTDDSEGEEDDDTGLLKMSVSLDDIQSGKYCLLYCHPESLLTKKMLSILRSKSFESMVCAVVIDEVHMIAEWGSEFRPAFQKLGQVTCLLPDCAHLSLTATATPERVEEIGRILMYKDPSTVIVNPDRPNIYLEKVTSPPVIRKFDKYDHLIKPLCEQLADKVGEFPVTVVYVESLEALGYYYQFLDHTLGVRQYVGDKIPENRIFCQYHKDYTAEMKKFIINELGKEDPKIRLVLATVALGMGLNSPSITRIIHARPPTTLEQYFQEIGRAGRIGQKASALMYYNNTDLSSGRKGLDRHVVHFCRNDTKCLRSELLNYFGFDHSLFRGGKSDCCSNCAKEG